MVRSLIRNWWIFLLGLIPIGIGVYRGVQPAFTLGSKEGWYALGGALLFVWVLSAVVEKKNS